MRPRANTLFVFVQAFHIQLQFDLFLCRRLSDSAGVDGECSATACANSLLSDEGTPVTTTPPSTEPPPIITQGEEGKLAGFQFLWPRIENRWRDDSDSQLTLFHRCCWCSAAERPVGWSAGPWCGVMESGGYSGVLQTARQTHGQTTGCYLWWDD